MESWVQSWRPRTNAFATTAPATKSDARSYEVLHLSRKIISANLRIWCSKMQPVSGNQRPDLLTALMNMSLVLRLPRKMHLSRSSSNVPRLQSILEMAQNPHVLLTFDKVHNPLHLPRETTSERQKVVGACGAFNILTSKCASRHNGVHFFDISTSKCAPELKCFVHVDFEMCFAPQRRALFRHHNFQKWSKHGVFCTFWLRNVLRATTAWIFLTSQLRKVLRTWGVFSFFTCKCALGHDGVQFFISHLASWLRTRRFSEPTFRPSGATNHWKNSVSQLFYLFAHLDLLSSETVSFVIFFLLLFFSLTLPISAFHLSILSEVWLLNFLRLAPLIAIDNHHSYNPLLFSTTMRLVQGSKETVWDAWAPAKKWTFVWQVQEFLAGNLKQYNPLLVTYPL